MKAAKVKGPKGFRWHPMMIRWCLNLKMVSSAAYHAIRSAGFVTLPSETTLRDYSNFFQSKPGFQHEINKQLMREAKLKELDDLQRHVVLVFDEMKIKSGLQQKQCRSDRLCQHGRYEQSALSTRRSLQI